MSDSKVLKVKIKITPELLSDVKNSIPISENMSDSEITTVIQEFAEELNDSSKLVILMENLDLFNF